MKNPGNSELDPPESPSLWNLDLRRPVSTQAPLGTERGGRTAETGLRRYRNVDQQILYLRWVQRSLGTGFAGISWGLLDEIAPLFASRNANRPIGFQHTSQTDLLLRFGSLEPHFWFAKRHMIDPVRLVKKSPLVWIRGLQWAIWYITYLWRLESTLDHFSTFPCYRSIWGLRYAIGMLLGAVL